VVVSCATFRFETRRVSENLSSDILLTEKGTVTGLAIRQPTMSSTEDR
jgi:hypothetical protein